MKVEDSEGNIFYEVDYLSQETVFIDDKLENIEAAKKLNFKTIHLVDPNIIELEIEKFLVL